MSRLTLGIVGRTLFSRDLDDERRRGRPHAARGAGAHERARDALHAVAAVVADAAQPAARARRSATLDRVVFDIIEARRRTDEAHDDLLDMLLRARDEETGEGMTDRQLRDEVMTFVLAGHETTAVALAWTWYLLARHPRGGRARCAPRCDRVLGGRTPTVEDLPRLAYTRMVVEEAMRLYPPVWGFFRQALGPDMLGGTPSRRAPLHRRSAPT